METWMIVLIVMSSVLLITIIAFLLLGVILYKITFSRRKNDLNFAELEDPKAKQEPDRVWFWEQNREDLEIISYDKLHLKGYLIKNSSNKFAILVHGYHGRYYSTVIQARMFYEHGYNVLLINNRCHDTSDGKTFSMGPKESRDLEDWINKIIKINENAEIVLYGISMGAHIVMLQAGKELPKNVKCIVEDCGYSNLKNELIFQTKNALKSLSKIAVLSCDIFCRIFHKFTLNSDVKISLEKSKLPICLIHGDQDTYVPYGNMKIISSYIDQNVYYEENTFEGANHCGSMYNKDKYKEVLIDFVDKFIK